VEYGFHALLVLIGILLSVMTRHLPPEYGQSSILLSVMYTFIGIGVFEVAILSTIRLEKASLVLIKAFGAYCCVLGCLYSMFASKFSVIVKENTKKRGGSVNAKSGPTLDDFASSSAGQTSSANNGETSMISSDLKVFKKAFATAEVCYVREKTSLGLIIWTPYIITAPSNEPSFYLFSSRASTQIIYLFASDWTGKISERDASVSKKESFHAIKLTRTLKALVSEPEYILRFKESVLANEWLQILSMRMKVQTDSLLGVQGNAAGISRQSTQTRAGGSAVGSAIV
ncbi:hypothetical protein HDU67_009195, partial [Dinochytrium kinnereticum]